MSKRLILALAVVACVVAACGGDDEARPTVSGDPAEDGTTVAANDGPDNAPTAPTTDDPNGGAAATTTDEPDGGDRPARFVVGDFESGSLDGWRTEVGGAGDWFVYTDGHTAPDPDQSDPNFRFAMPDPPQGEYAAVTDTTNPGRRILYRDVALTGQLTLQLTVFYENSVAFTSPDTLDYTVPQTNQQFRVDLVDTAAPIDSVADGDVLLTAFRTEPDDPLSLDPTLIEVDVSELAGRTVRLRLAQTDNRGTMRVGVDDIAFVPIDDAAEIDLPETPDATEVDESGPDPSTPSGETLRSTERFEPAFSLDVPEAWQLVADVPAAFAVESQDQPAGMLAVLADPAPLPSEPPTDADEPTAVVSSADELEAWLVEHPELATSDPEPVTVGGVEGILLDVGIAADSTSSPSWCDAEACVAVIGTHDSSDPDAIGFALLGADDTLRVILIEHADTTLAVVADPDSPVDTPGEAAFLAQAGAAIDSITFES
ncbi:MAG: hypothetical protein GEU79_11105 [Acidimicrobiia bacterium]|nr:hypothetical protein [Acidimicrobiia bacterium]